MSQLKASYGDAATKALKLYDGGVVLNVKPDGAKLSTACSLRTSVALTEQLETSGSFNLDKPEGTVAEDVLLPHASVTLAGAVACTIAQR